MTRTPDRTGPQGWQAKWPLSKVAVVLIAFVLGIGIFTYQECFIWTPLQRWYFSEYSLNHDFPTTRGNYWLSMKTDRNGHHSVAGNSDVVPDFRGRRVGLHQSPLPLHQPGASCSKLGLPVEHFSANGKLSLNCLSHPRGQAQVGPNQTPPLPFAVYAVDLCDGAEGVTSYTTNVPGAPRGTGSTINAIHAIENDMIGNASLSVIAQCVRRH